MTGTIKIKICGMRDPENIREVAACAPDFMGFIFYPESVRFVGNDFTMPEDFPEEIERVGVFVQETTETIAELANRHNLGFIQLHGGESAVQCAELKNKGLKIIKVFSVDDEFDFSTVKDFVPVTDYFLFDTKSTAYGGSGKTFNWSLLGNYRENKPFFLSGGLTVLNCKSALHHANKNLAGLDFNSGVESKPGLKNRELVKEIVAGGWR
jgi:phosphoribosylanthranilate isomerase